MKQRIRALEQKTGVGKVQLVFIREIPAHLMSADLPDPPLTAEQEAAIRSAELISHQTGLLEVVVIKVLYSDVGTVKNSQLVSAGRRNYNIAATTA